MLALDRTSVSKMIRKTVVPYYQLITRASLEKPESENATVFSPKGGSWSQAFHKETEETGDENATLLACDRIRWFANNVLASFAPNTFGLHSKVWIFF